jgi:hypothetical protein
MHARLHPNSGASFATEKVNLKFLVWDAVRRTHAIVDSPRVFRMLIGTVCLGSMDVMRGKRFLDRQMGEKRWPGVVFRGSIIAGFVTEASTPPAAVHCVHEPRGLVQRIAATLHC